MNKIVYLFLLLSSAMSARSQNDLKPGEMFYLLDSNFQTTAEEKAIYFIHTEKIHDSCWQVDKYRMYGPIISSAQYKDEKGTKAQGHFSYYNKKGKIDSSGNYMNGLQDGDWYYMNDTCRYYLQKNYTSGKLISITDIIRQDSINKVKNDTTAINARSETEADFVGGQSRWIYYLGKNMHYPQRAQKGVIQGTVAVQFFIDEEGNVIMPEISQSVEYSIDREALRLIKSSPTWTPGVRAGENIKSFKRQPLTFRLEAN